MCITNIRQRNLSTNKGYRATFTKAQVGKDSGTEAGQYGSFYRFPKISTMPLQNKEIPCEEDLHILVQANTSLMQSGECSYAQL